MNSQKITLILCCILAMHAVNAQQSQAFTYTGSAQSWTVPCNVTSITVDMAGAQGGSISNLSQAPATAAGGLGGRVQCTLPVTGGAVLQINVGGQGESDGLTLSCQISAAGWNGGGTGYGGYNSYNYNAGGGGGASDICQSPYGCANVMVIAGAGGGAACTGCTGGGVVGGLGGGLIGGNGGYANCQNYAYGGTQSGGGAAATFWGAGTAGSACTGGSACSGGCGVTCGGGGGGGGGYYGGGGGSLSGGGGGSSYTMAGASAITHTQGYQSGNGYVTITWTGGGGSLTISGNVINNVLCHGESDGEASGIITGGASPYTYSWAPAGGSKDTASGLSAGNYIITVSDACGNSATASVSITQPTALSVSIDSVRNVLCNGENNGRASSATSGGTSPYTYSWSNGGGSNSRATGLSAGNYSITVTDKNGCTGTASAAITQPNVLSVSASVVSNVLCNGESNGSAASNVSGGTGPYTYSWSNGGTADTATGLSAGAYTLGIADANGCTASASVNITQPNALSVSAGATANELCNGGSIGSASSAVTGGSAPYTYLWSNGGTTDTATGLSAGVYALGLTDANGCTASTSINITQPTVLSVSPSVLSNLSCNGDSSGSASSNISGGTGPYTYLWSNGGTNDTAMGLSAGTYNINVTDANGCTNSATASITQPTAIVIVPNSKPDIGHDVGAAWVNVSGGVGPYTYLWNPGGNTTDSISQKDTGTYCCMVRDSNGCEDSVCIKIKLTAGIGNITSGSGDITVYPNPNNGQFTIVIAGEAKQSQDVVEIYNVLGERVYSQYLISNSQFLINLSNQPNGIYLYRVISGSGSLLGEGKIMLQK